MSRKLRTFLYLVYVKCVREQNCKECKNKLIGKLQQVENKIVNTESKIFGTR